MSTGYEFIIAYFVTNARLKSLQIKKIVLISKILLQTI